MNPDERRDRQTIERDRTETGEIGSEPRGDDLTSGDDDLTEEDDENGEVGAE
ncbi:MAG: hypothetical protein JOZ38_08800 [Candidatus Eremiobacteraeota bacterium]|nr:hypothetical protein [Candidatus Eremiobacteraeota bacterium]